MSNRSPVPAAEAAAPVFAALGDPTRLALLSRLCDGQSQSIVQLTQGTGLSRQGVKKHLTVMEHAGIVTSNRVGRESQFTVRPETLAETSQYLARASQQWSNAIDRLKQHLGE